jgi:hypothetical protein
MSKKAADYFNYLNFQKTIKLAVFNYGLSPPSGTVDRKSFLSDSESQPTKVPKNGYYEID